jgi:hypothetical protein
MEDKKPPILRAEQIADSIQAFSHPWNPKSEIFGTYIGRAVGLKRTFVPIGTKSLSYVVKSSKR